MNIESVQWRCDTDVVWSVIELKDKKVNSDVRESPLEKIGSSYAKATAGPRTDPPPQTKTNSTPSENIKALMSVISIIDIGEVVLLANKFKAAANPVEKILILAEHAPLVEAIKIAKSNPAKK
ncbi:hypothetical protein EVAR_15856_1 [Eumeta japonica]|uniref:Uncharacterized protein n=1 Tax=Eumeta variegata TaxID=151549 RepID=A0A4C1UEU8_EUMVA|nr:hypothetical protein EVAR_15856_1 [Eumeta japonica]